MLSRRTLYAALSVGIVGLVASVLSSFAQDRVRNPDAEDRSVSALNDPAPAEPSLKTNQFESLEFDQQSETRVLQSEYLDLHRRIAANLSEDELRNRIRAAEHELAQSMYEKDLQRIKSELEQLLKRYPNDPIKRAQRAIDALQPNVLQPVESQRTF